MTRRENGLMSREVRDSEVARDDVADLSLAGEAKNGNDDKYRVPTHDEMSQFKEAEDMFQSNLFSMEVFAKCENAPSQSAQPPRD